ncbi:restriction endonuclease subunit S [Pseudokineococcus sp. 1T1Z-3]|uniref:restriction endonuclease subunit S n=1 Tax=Pseudokineococcus sp. 1T1Z-3 TaxID=3132745 RepID=UPI0030A0AFA6
MTAAGSVGKSVRYDYDAPACFAGFLVRVRPPSDLHGRFLTYWCQSKPYWDQLATGAVRSTIENFSAGRYRSMMVPQPAITQQQRIVDYLDRETAQIDALIGKQERLIETLRERRVVKLSEVIDRGGHAAWKLRRLVDPARPMSYGILQAGEPQTEGVPYIGPSDMPGEGAAPQVHTLRRTTPEIAAQYQRSVLSDRDVVVSIGPAFGKVAVLTSAHTGANLTQDTVRVACRTERLVPEYLVHVLGSLQVKHFWRRQIAGATFVRLNLGTLATTPIPLPDVAKQRRLIAEIDDHTARTDDLIAKADSFIALARERRAALITAAVTGQIDVRVSA